MYAKRIRMNARRVRFCITIKLDNGFIGDILSQIEPNIGSEATIKVTVNGKTIEATGLITEILAVDCFTV